MTYRDTINAGEAQVIRFGQVTIPFDADGLARDLGPDQIQALAATALRRERFRPVAPAEQPSRSRRSRFSPVAAPEARDDAPPASPTEEPSE